MCLLFTTIKQVILNSDSFIESVLNTAALLFIPEIDDTLPDLLGFGEPSIYKNFLIHESLDEYDTVCLMQDYQNTMKLIKLLDDAIGVQFSDFYLTNWPEQGSNLAKGVHFKPHEVKMGKIMKNGVQMGHSIYSTNFITEDCLVEKIVWKYTAGYDHTIKPRIGYLRLEMICGEIIEINSESFNLKCSNECYSLEGVFIITAFEMSSAILRLRICGSYNAQDFLKALDYYALWDISSHAKKMLLKHEKTQYESKPIQKYSSWIGNPEKDVFVVNDYTAKQNDHAV